MGRVSLLQRRQLSVSDQQLPAELTNGLKHRKTWFTVLLLDRRHEAGRDQRIKMIDALTGRIGPSLAAPRRRLDRTATGEYREPPEHALLIFRQQVVAPGNGLA